MPQDRFLIAPFQSGLETNLPPWLIAEDAFSTLENAYVFRGRLRKRFGGTLMGYGWTSSQTAPLFSRFSVLLGTTDGSGDISGMVPGIIYDKGQLFSIGDEIFTVAALGTPVIMKTTGATPTRTYDTDTGDYVFAGAAADTDVYFYPAQPVMGLTQYQSGPVNDQPSYGFDTQFAYVFANGFWSRSDTAGTPIFTGDNDQFFWASNWRGDTPNVKVLFVTNFNEPDDMYYFDGTTWAAFTPFTKFNSNSDFVQTARIIIGFQDRLLLLNTIEEVNGSGVQSSHVNRVRWSWNGDPFAANAWLEPNNAIGADKAAGGGFLDASTEEAIISVEFIKNRLIVFFERSTWELAYTRNEINPFVWQKINTELGSESLLSSVPFDKVILTVGSTGIHACNGANVERIDLKIPQKIFQLRDSNSGPQRVDGIRDYFTELVYWTYPSSNQRSSNVFPNKVLVYNYRNNTWALNDDTITTFGYFDQQVSSTWANNLLTWEQANFSWDSGSTQSNFRQVIAGNQQGFVFMIRPQVTRNAPVLQITNIENPLGPVTVTVMSHNLSPNEFVAVERVVGAAGLNGNIYKVIQVIDADTIIINNLAGNAVFAGDYLGGGTLTRVSNILVKSKQWNPYVDQAQNVYVAKIDFALQKTAAGQVTVDYSPSSTEISMLTDASQTGAIMGTGILETYAYPTVPLEASQERLWHPVYFQCDGECIQIAIFMNDTQMSNTNIAWAPFEVQGMVLHTNPTSDRLQ